jgi:integrase
MKERSISYYIHNEVFVFANFQAADGRVRVSTGVTLSEGETLANLPKYKKNRLTSLTKLVDEHTGNCYLAGRQVIKADVIAIIKSEQGVKPVNHTVLSIATQYYELALQGQAFNKQGHVVSDGTIKAYENTISVIDKKLGDVPINSLSVRDFLHWRGRLSAKVKISKKGKELRKLSQNSITTYNNVLLSMISATRRLGWHDTILSGAAAGWEAIDYAVYYSIEELQALYNHRFENEELERVRDVFVFGCFTCLRHSDYFITDYRDAIKDNSITVKLKKKKNQVVIPLHPVALEILEKYDYVLPKIIIMYFNRDIKEVCKEAGFDSKVLFTRTHGGKLVREYKEKWELTTSHTMRRSFATNALKSGMEQWAVMSIGGWKSEASFKKYLRMSGQDVKDHALASSFYGVRL